MTPISTTLPPEPASVPTARRFVTDTLASWGLQVGSEAAEMLASELVTNAVLHARTTFTVEVSCDGDGVRVSVRDRSPAPPRTRSYGTDSTTGRGMRLVATLATSWGTERHGDGKTVWFVIGAASDDHAELDWDDAAVDALLARFSDDRAAGPATPTMLLRAA